MSRIINQNTEPLFIFDMPDDHLLSETISVKGEKGERGDPTKLSQLENDDGFITADTDALVNYYDKTTTDGKLDQKLDKSTFDDYEIPSDFFTGNETVNGSGNSVTLNGTIKALFNQLDIYGATAQNGSPTPESPISVQTATGSQTIIITDGLQTQTYTLNLGDMELCVLGDYQDYIYKSGAKWYKHKAVGKYTISGSESFTWDASVPRLYLPANALSALDISCVFPTNNNDTATALVNKFTVKSFTQVYTNKQGGFAMSPTGRNWQFSDLGWSDEIDARADIVGTTVYYALSSATDEEITDAPLIAQLEELKKATSYDGTTIVSVSGSIAANLAVASFKTNWNGAVAAYGNNLSEIEKNKADTSLVNKKAYTFDNVAKMAEYNLAVGDLVITSGFYSNNDGGGAKYKIIESQDTADGSSLIALDNGLKAQLIIGASANVKQFGAKGDNTTDDTAAIQKALDTCKHVEFTNETYKVVYVQFRDDQTVEGNGATLNCELNTTPLIGMGSHLTIRNLEIHSLNNDREWNRIGLRNKSYITFENCTFSGFQQQPTTQSTTELKVWALFIQNSHDIRVINCKFVDNNFQDILIEFDNYNLYFENCTGAYDGAEGLFVDVEPSEGSLEGRLVNKNILFNDCIFRGLRFFEYYNQVNQNLNISVDNCIVNNLYYKGGDVAFNNSPILSFDALQSNSIANSDGSLILNNSINIGENLIKDPYLKDVSYRDNTNWVCTYASTSWKNLLQRVHDQNGDYLSMNKDNLSSALVAISSTNIEAAAGELFLVKQNARAFYPSSGAGTTANHTRVIFYNSSDEVISTLKLRNNRGENNTVQDFTEKSNIIACPTGTAYFTLQLRNGDAESSSSADYRAIGVYKLTPNVNARNNISDLGSGNGKSFYAKENPATSASNKINHFAGERCYYDEPSTYVGAVAIADDTWKEFGALES